MLRIRKKIFFGKRENTEKEYVLTRFETRERERKARERAGAESSDDEVTKKRERKGWESGGKACLNRKKFSDL